MAAQDQLRQSADSQLTRTIISHTSLPAEFTRMKEELPDNISKSVKEGGGEEGGEGGGAGEGGEEKSNGEKMADGVEEEKGEGGSVGEGGGGGGGGGKLPEALSMPSEGNVQTAAASALAAAAIKAKVRGGK